MKLEIKHLTKDNPNFPDKLKDYKLKVKELFVAGNEKILNDFSIGIVGSRNCSQFGLSNTERIAKELSLNKINIISGLAIGIDSAAHIGCINGNGKTIAVLGGGLHKFYPKTNQYLFERIIDNGGAVITEYYHDAPPLPKNFLERNRIIAGLSNGIILSEAKERSGSLTTVRRAIEMNKKVFVIPGGLDDEYFDGSNRILSDGAICVRNANDVLKHFDEFRMDKSTKKCYVEKSIVPDNLKEIYLKVKTKPTSFEEIVRSLDEDVSEILTKLLLLELEGYIKSLKGEKYVRLI